MGCGRDFQYGESCNEKYLIRFCEKIQSEVTISNENCFVTKLSKKTIGKH